MRKILQQIENDNLIDEILENTDSEIDDIMLEIIENNYEVCQSA